MKKNFNVLVLMFVLVFSSHAQEKYKVLQQGEQGMIPRAIKFDQEPITFSTPESFMKQFFNIPPSQGILITEKNQDELGFTHYRLQQTINGTPVDNSMYLIHVKDGKVITANGEWFSTVPASLYAKKGTLTSAQALEKAKTVVKAKKYAWEIGNAQKNGERHFMGEKVSDRGELVYFTDNNELNSDKLKLAYKFDMYATAPLQRSDVYVNAIDGSILFSSQKIYSVDGTTDTGYHGQQNITVTQGGSGYVTSQTGSRSVAMRNMNGANVNWQVEPTNATLVTSTSTSFNFSGNDKYYMSAYWGMEKTWDMFSSVFNRSSYDGNGSNINLYVNGSGQQGDNNAFWAGTWTFFGNNTNGGTPFTPLDVVGHEIAHGVTGTSAKLRYQRESGALNEAFSDIFGAYVEYFAFNTINEDVWTLGDKISLKRSLSNPKQYNQPDTYGGTNWKEPNCGTPTNQNDQCGVHTNSGVLNHWFYLLSQGGQGSNDSGNSYTVEAIGIEKAGKIAFRALTNYLSQDSNYAAARTAVINAATDIHGASSCEVKAVTNAMYAIGVGQQFSGTANCGGTPTCTDGVQNGDETGVDCGGSCEPCSTTVTYCPSNGQSTSDEYVSNIKLGTINKTSTAGSGGYSDFTAESTSLSKGNPNTITITPAWTGTKYNEAYSVWIDYNQDGDFADTGEQVWTNAASQTTPVSGSFTVPASAKDGSTRMRVSMRYNTIPSPCESFDYGEVEDYTVTIGGSTGGDTQAPSAPSGLTASNVAQTTLTLSWNAATDNVGVTGYDVYQGTTLLGSANSTSTNITELTANTAYQFSVKAKDAAGNVSGSSNSVNVTTTGGSTDPCAGVAPYNGSVNYQVGDRVTYQGYLYELTASGWNNLGACGAFFATAFSATPTAPPFNEQLKAYPNPVSGTIINIDTQNHSSKEYMIFNILGQTVDQGTFITIINVQELKTGSYFVKVGDKTVQFVKQ